MKTILIGVNSQFVHVNLAIRSLSASLEHKSGFLEFNINTDKISVFGQIIEKEADLIMFSSYIWNIDYILDIAKDIKKANPNVKIALGGPEVSFTAKEIISENDFIDYVLCGEFEETMPIFLDRLEKNKPLDGLTGVVSKDYQDTTYNIVSDINVLKPAREIYNVIEENRIYYYETTRGCPFSCSYCLSGSIKDTTRDLDLERVYEDLKYFSDNNIPLVKFVDRTFNANKKRAKEIIKFACKNTGNTSFHFEVGADILDDEIIELLNNSPVGKFQLEAGVQSCNTKTIEAVIRVTDLEKLAENTKKIIAGKNVHLHLDLIAGLPYEGYESFGRSIDRLYDLNPHHLQLGFLKLLKGSTLLADAKKYGIVYREYPPYEVISTNELTAWEMIKLKDVEEIIERYYNADIGRTAMNILKQHFDTAFEMIETMAKEFRHKGYITRPMGISNRLDVLCEFAKKYIKELPIWEDFLLCVLEDILKNGAKGTFPSALDDIIIKIDNKKAKNNLFEQKRISGEQFKKAKFIIVKIKDKTQIMMTYNGSINIFEGVEI